MEVSATSLGAPVFQLVPLRKGTLAVSGGGSSKTGVANSLTTVHVEDIGEGKQELAKAKQHQTGSTFITTAAASNDEKRIAGAAGDTIIIYNFTSSTDSLEEVVRFKGDFAAQGTPEVNALAWGEGHTTLASGGADGVVRVWNIPGDVGEGGASLPTLVAECAGHTAPIEGLAVNAVGGLVASGSQDGTARVWCVPCLRGAEGQGEDVYSWVLPPVAPTHITTPSRPRPGRKQRHTSPGTFKYVRLAFLEDTLIALETSQFGAALASVWVLEQAGVIPANTPKSGGGSLGVITRDPRPASFVFVPAAQGGGASQAGEGEALTALTGEVPPGPPAPPAAVSAVLGEWEWQCRFSKVVTPRAAATMALTPCGRSLAISCGDKNVYEFGLPDFNYVGRYVTGHSFGAMGLAYTADGAHLLTASADHSVKAWSRVQPSWMWVILAVVALALLALGWWAVQ